MIRPRLLEVVGPWVGLSRSDQPGRSTRGLIAGMPAFSQPHFLFSQAREFRAVQLRAGTAAPSALAGAARSGDCPLSHASASRTIPADTPPSVAFWASCVAHASVLFVDCRRQSRGGVRKGVFE
jgi:hypothetical protein